MSHRLTSEPAAPPPFPANENRHLRLRPKAGGPEALFVLGLTRPDQIARLPVLPHRARIEVFSCLTRLAGVLHRHRGSGAVVCPLIGPDFDALDVARRLATLGFRGRLTVLAPALPNPRMVRREIEAAGKGLVVSLETQPPRGRLN